MIQLDITQIQELLSIIDRNQAVVIAKEFGIEFLTEEDKERLELAGIDVSKLYSPELDTIFTSFNLGMLSEALGQTATKLITYDMLKEYIKGGEYIPLTKRELFTINAIRMQSFNDVKALNGRIFRDVNNILIDNSLQSQQELLRTELEAGEIKKKTVRQVSNAIAEKTGDWSRDFDRIIEYASNTAMENGKADMMEASYGEDVKVYKKVYQAACSSCISLYLKGGIGSEPRIFTLRELRANGTNIGVKKADWKPVIGSTHPYCFDDKTEVLTDSGWKYFKNLDKNEKFLSFDLKTGIGEWVYAKNWVNQYYEGKMYHYTSDTFDLMTTPNHHHVVKKLGGNKGNHGKLSFVESKDLNDNMQFIRALPEWYGERKNEFVFDNNKYDAELFCEFLGFYLSEGHYGYESYRHKLIITQSKDKYFDEIYNCAKRLFVNHTIWKSEKNGKIIIGLKKGDKELIEYFKSFGKSYEKYIPNEIKNLSIDLLMKFLDAYRMGDGSVIENENKSTNHHNFHTIFYTSSKKMADDLSEAIIKVGYSPSIKVRQPEPVYCKHADKMYLSKHVQYVVSFNKSKTAYIKCLDKNIVSYSGFIYDVELEKNHTLFVRRNGKVTVSGNCRCSLHHLPDNYKWNEETKEFDIAEKPKLIRKPIRIRIGDKELTV